MQWNASVPESLWDGRGHYGDVMMGRMSCVVFDRDGC